MYIHIFNDTCRSLIARLYTSADEQASTTPASRCQHGDANLGIAPYTIQETFLHATVLMKKGHVSATNFSQQYNTASRRRICRRRSKVQQGRFCSTRKILPDKEDSALQGRFYSARTILLHKGDPTRLEDSIAPEELCMQGEMRTKMRRKWMPFMVRRGRAHIAVKSLAKPVEEYVPNGLPMDSPSMVGRIPPISSAGVSRRAH